MRSVSLLHRDGRYYACSGVYRQAGGGAGTADAHWRESTFQTELMTGFVGAFNPFSIMSIQSLADVGYSTNQNAADSYVVPGSSASILLQSVLGGVTQWEVNEKPRFMMSTTGRVTRVDRQ